MYEKNVFRIEELTKKQNTWRMQTINLIASENVLSLRAREIMGSDFAHRYAEGHPGERYYQGTDIIDEIETRVKKHLKSLFRCRHVDVRPISGTVSNDSVFSIYIRPGDVVMANSTPGGGHISHHKAGSVGKYTSNIINFPLTKDGYHIDLERSLDLAHALKQKVMILGKSLFLFPEPVKELAEFCQKNETALIYDAAHVLGLIAGREFQDPLGDGALVVTGSTHKTLFGPQGGIVASWNRYADTIKKATFPGNVSNHHLHHLAGKAIAFAEMLEFGQEYTRQIVRNAKAFGQSLFERGFQVLGEKKGFTESHTILVDITKYGDGRTIEKALESANIILNRNLLPYDLKFGRHFEAPGGIRCGLSECTRLGMKETDMDHLAEFIDRIVIKEQDPKKIRHEVAEFRKNFVKVHYAFDTVNDAHEYFKLRK